MAVPVLDPLAALVGFAFSLVAGQVLTRIVLAPMTLPPKQDTDKPSYAGALGLVERTIYTSAVAFNQSGFIVVWFTLKIAKDLREKGGGRAAFNRWLVGSGLSLAFGVAGGLLASTKLGAWTDVPMWSWPALVPIGLAGLIWSDYHGPFKGWLDPSTPDR